MDINRFKPAILSLFMITIFSCLLPLSIHAGSRGISVISDLSHQSGKLGSYRALLIGISDYNDPKIPDLETAVNDASAMAKLLRERYGFQVKLLLNRKATREGIYRALRKLATSTKSDDSVLIYYAGHGDLDRTYNDGWWIPVDAKGGNPVTYLDNGQVQKAMRSMNARHVLLISDSCYSGTLFGQSRAIPQVIDNKYYLNLYNDKSRWGMTSGNKTPVSDRGTGGHSVFAYQLLKELRNSEKPYISTQELYTRIAPIISNNSEQTPLCRPIRNTGDQGGEFVFVASSGAVVEETATKPSEAYLSVESNVSGAKVLVNGRYIGTTNLAGIKISPGEHSVRVEKDGYESYSKRVRFKAGRSMSLTVFLDRPTPSKSNLYVDTHPKDARVRILNIGPVFYQGIGLDAGRYHVEVSTNDYETKKLWVTLGSGEDRSIDVRLKKRVVTPSSSYSSAKVIGRDGRFVAYDNGIVYDKNTNLEWYAGPDKNTNWDDAKNWAENLNVSDGGWRMPSKKELESLYKAGAGTRNMTPLLKTTGWIVWSGETVIPVWRDEAMRNTSAWAIHLRHGGDMHNSRNESFIRRGFAVRSRRYPKYSSISPEVSKTKVVARDGNFIAYANGTVKDTKTGLMWASKDNGEDINWKDAKRYCENYHGGGYTDWRMPTMGELEGLYEENITGYKQDCGSSYVEVKLTNLIHITCSQLWSSYTRTSQAMHFRFYAGIELWTEKSWASECRALPVRSGK